MGKTVQRVNKKERVKKPYKKEKNPNHQFNSIKDLFHEDEIEDYHDYEKEELAVLNFIIDNDF